MVEPLQACYLLTGSEPLLVSEFMSGLRLRLFGKEATGHSLDLQEYDAETAPFSEVSDFLRTAPFMASKRLAVLREPSSLPAEDRERLTAYVSDPSPTGVLVMVCTKGSPKKDKFLAALSGHAQTVNCYAPFPDRLASWVSARAHSHGAAMDREAAETLVDRAGEDLGALDGALEALSVYAHPRTKLSSQDVRAVLGRSARSDVFDLIDAIADKKAATAFGVLEDMFREGESAYEIVAQLASHLSRVGTARPGQGNSRYDRSLSRWSVALTAADAARLMNALCECDAAIKTGLLPERLALERFVLGAFKGV